MILSFSQTWPWNNEPTHFVSKIKSNIKLHTIREDKHRRWREGMDIHFATGVRTPDYNQFEFGVCTGVQEIEVVYNPKRTGNNNIPSRIYIDGEIFFDDLSGSGISKVIKLAKNDGFDGITGFFRWFDEDFEGRLIHWAGKEY